MKNLTIALAFLMTLSLPVSAQDLQKGFAAAQAGDFATAIQEWTPLAEAGDASAQIALGALYEFGQGVLQDYAEAVRLYRLVADQGYAYGQYNLATMYFVGQGVPQDDAEAVRLFRLAAEQGDASAQTDLGYMYAYGKGVLHDNVTAHMWYNISAANGNELGGTNRDSISKGMTQQAIEQAQQMARECMSSNYQNCGG
ncbi:SEL1-like repeat protein [bacterium]|nr:SEL1-like repeat protein [bacterium]